MAQLLFVFCGWLLPVLAHHLLIRPGEEVPLAERGGGVYVQVLLHGLLAMALIAFIIRRSGQSWRGVGLTCRAPGLDVLAAGAALMTIYLSQFVIVMVAGILSPEFLFQMAKERVKVLYIFPSLHPAVTVAFCLFVGLYEELLFRGFLLTRLRVLFGGWTGPIVFSSVFFAVSHLYEGGFAILQIFILSLVLSIVFVGRGSLVPVALAHAVFDMITFLAAYLIRFQDQLQKLLPQAG